MYFVAALCRSVVAGGGRTNQQEAFTSDDLKIAHDYLAKFPHSIKDCPAFIFTLRQFLSMLPLSPRGLQTHINTTIDHFSPIKVGVWKQDCACTHA